MASTVPSHVDILQQTDGQEGGDQRRPAVGDERQRDPGDGHDADGHADVDEGLEGQHGHHPGGQEGAEGVAGHGGDAQSPPQEQPEQQQQDHGAGEAELLADHGEDEVGLLLGNVLEVGLGAVQVALAGDAARADGDQGLPRVVGEASSTVVGAGVDERGQPLLLVLAEHVELEHAYRGDHPDQGQDQQPAQLDPLTSRTPNRMATNTMKVPKSGWSRISAQTSAMAASPAASRRGPGASRRAPKTAARTTMVPTLAYSDGWTW